MAPWPMSEITELKRTMAVNVSAIESYSTLRVSRGMAAVSSSIK